MDITARGPIVYNVGLCAGPFGPFKSLSAATVEENNHFGIFGFVCSVHH